MNVAADKWVVVVFKTNDSDATMWGMAAIEPFIEGFFTVRTEPEAMASDEGALPEASLIALSAIVCIEVFPADTSAKDIEARADYLLNEIYG